MWCKMRLALTMATMAVCGCATQSGGTWSSWVSSFNPAPPPAIVEPSPQIPQRAQQWTDVEPEVHQRQIIPPQQPRTVQQEKQPVQKQPPPAAQAASPQPTVTSTMNTASRQEAVAAIDEVDKRLAIASADPRTSKSSQLSVVRQLRDSGQEAINEKDYLTARSLAQKASVLAAQLPAASHQSPLR
jgi:hypothetical protein